MENTEVSQEMPLDEASLKEVVSTLPAPVKKFFASGKTREVAKRILGTYQLHIDQAAIVQREIIMLLLGLSTPDSFAKTLSEEAQLDQKTVSSIVNDVNEQIFIPLHEEMRNATKTPQSQTPVAPAPSDKAVTTPSTSPQAAPTPHEEAMTLPPKSALPQTKIAPPATVAAAVPPRPSFATPPQPAALPKSEPSINKLAGWRSDAPAAPAVPQTTPSQSPPAQSFPNTAPVPVQNVAQPVAQNAPSAPVARTAPPPPNLPGAMPEAPQAVTPPAPPTPPIVKSYASDPYREPIDDGA